MDSRKQQEYGERYSDRSQPIRKRPAIFNKVSEIEPQKHYNITVKVMKIEHQVTLKRVEGDPIKIVICLVGDESGSARIILKEKQIAFAEVGAVLNLRNVQARIARDKLRLEVSIWGKIEKATDVSIVLLSNFIRKKWARSIRRTIFPKSSTRLLLAEENIKAGRKGN